MSANVTGTTDASGRVALISRGTKKPGTFTFRVTGVSAAGYTYDPGRNIETTDSISR